MQTGAKNENATVSAVAIPNSTTKTSPHIFGQLAEQGKYSHLPDKMRKARRWLVWVLVPQVKGKPKKEPHYVSGTKRHGTLDSAEDVAQMATFDDALEALKTGRYTGLGFALGPDGNGGFWQGVDLDHLPEHPELQTIADDLPGYTERSPSGDGLHAIGYGRKFDALGSNTTGIEAYSYGRYFTVTADSAGGGDVCELADFVEGVLRPLHGQQNPRQPKHRQEVKNDAGSTISAADCIDQQTVDDLRSALQSMNADEYGTWIENGQRLKSLGDTGRELWLEWSATSDKFDEDEAAHKWGTFTGLKSGYAGVFATAQAGGWVNPQSNDAASRKDYSDAGNVAILAEQTGGDLRYVYETKQWICWCGKRWNPDPARIFLRKATLGVAEHYLRDAKRYREQARADGTDAKDRKLLERLADHAESWARHCRNERALSAMVTFAQQDARFTLSQGQLDKNPLLFGVNNGVIDLRTGALRPDSRDDFVTKRSPIDWTNDATAPRWIEFVGEITATPDPINPKKGTPRPNLARYVQRMLGYCLTGKTTEQKLFLAIGDGSNGKNVLLDTVRDIMGTYATPIAAEALMARKYESDAERPTPGARMLAGARLAVASESRETASLDTNLVKRLTGESKLVTRGLHENTFAFDVTHKLVLMTNHMPRLDAVDDATRGRLHLIPFDRQWNRPGHPNRNPLLPDGDKDMLAKLQKESPGILRWLVDGAVAYLRDGLEPPIEVASKTSSYFDEQDAFTQWLAGFEHAPAKEGMLASDLLGNFRYYCLGTGTAEVSQIAFAKKLKKAVGEGTKSERGMLYPLRTLNGDLF